MIREKYKRRTRKAESTEVLNRGGQVRSSDEVTVMVMERRDLATWLRKSSQLNFSLGGTV
jgi:hypothetical protein